MRNNTYNALVTVGAIASAGVGLAAVIGAVQFIAHRTPAAAPVNCTYTYDDRHGVGSITVTWDDETCALIHKRAERR